MAIVFVCVIIYDYDYCMIISLTSVNICVAEPKLIYSVVVYGIWKGCVYGNRACTRSLRTFWYRHPVCTETTNHNTSSTLTLTPALY